MFAFKKDSLSTAWVDAVYMKTWFQQRKNKTCPQKSARLFCLEFELQSRFGSTFERKPDGVEATCVRLTLGISTNGGTRDE